MRLGSSYWFIALVLVSVSWGANGHWAVCHAQTVVNPAINPSLNPGAVLQGLKNPANNLPNTGQLNNETNSEQAPPPVLEFKEVTPLPNSALPVVGGDAIFISRINLQGNTKLNEKDLKALLAPYEGKQTSFASLQTQLIPALVNLYKTKGFITSYAFIPPQTLSNSELTIQCVEGKVAALEFKEDAWFKTRSVVPRMLTGKGDVLQINDLVKDIRRLNDNPDLKVTANLKPSQTADETIVVLEPVGKTHHTIHLSPYFDNLGRSTIGQLRSGFTVTNNNLLGVGDQLFTTHAWSKHSYSTFNSYEVPVGRHGTKLAVSQGFSNFKFDVVPGVPIAGTSLSVNSMVKQELYRTESLNIQAELGFAIKNSKVDFNDTPNSEDKLRVLTQAITLEHQDRTGRTYMRHELAEGIKAFGATTGSIEDFARDYVPSRFGAGSQFVRYTGSLSRVQRLPFQTYGIFRALGQITPDPLASAEQFQIGGAQTVRGYREGRFIGDSGFILSGELHAPLRFLPNWLGIPKLNYRLKDQLEVITFLEGGGVFDNKVRTPGTPGVDASSGRVKASAWALSTGVGLRLRVNELMNLRMDVGFPLFEPEPQSETARLHVGLEGRLF